MNSNNTLNILACIGLLTIVSIACGGSSGRNPSSEPIGYPSPPPDRTVAPSKTASPSTPSEEKKAEYRGYRYTYVKEGNTTAALFLPKFLPRDDTIFLGATQDIIRRSYKESVSSNASIVDWNGTRAIRVDSKNHGYIVVPVKEDTGEINSITVTQLP